MREYKTYKKEIKYVSKTICDKCNNEIVSDSSFDRFECTIQRVTGEVFPEGGFTETESVDLCQDCSIYLFDLLKKEGINIHKEDDD